MAVLCPKCKMAMEPGKIEHGFAYGWQWFTCPKCGEVKLVMM